MWGEGGGRFGNGLGIGARGFGCVWLLGVALGLGVRDGGLGCGWLIYGVDALHGRGNIHRAAFERFGIS